MKKKILLIQPENEEINNFRKRQFNNFVQLTIPYLAGYINESQYEITLIDQYKDKIPYNKTFDLVCITVNTPNANNCYTISKKFREKGSTIVLGGPHITLLPDEAREHGDVLMIGESEETWPRFLNDYYKDDYKDTYESKEIPKLDKLPMPRWDLLNRSKIFKGAVIATRGCPNKCGYCNLKQIYYNSFRTRPLEDVINEIKNIPSKFFVFWDDNFFADKEFTKKLLNKLKPLNKRWAAQVTIADCGDNDLLHLAREAGCRYLFVGLESFSSSSLEGVDKGINNTKRYKEIINKIHKNKILVQAGIVFGFDSDRKTVFDDTLKACEDIGIDGVTVSILTPFPKTPIYYKFKKEERLITEDWSKYNSKTAVVFTPKNMTSEELLHGYMSFRKRFYSLRSFIKRMKVSKTNIPYNVIINLGYKLAIKK